MTPRLILAIGWFVAWIGIGAYFVATNPAYRDPFAGDGRVALFWIIMTLMCLWNLARIWQAWPRRRLEPPPIRRSVGDDDNPFADP